MFTVSFYNKDKHEQVSRVFDNQKQAHKWAVWLSKQTWASTINVYRGQAGGELLETFNQAEA